MSRQHNLALTFVVGIVISSTIYIYWPKHHPPSTVIQAQTTECDAADAQNWCQAGRLPQRTAFYPTNLGTTMTHNWSYGFSPDKLFRQVQPIIYKASDNTTRAYLGSEGGNVYALRITDGSLTAPAGWKVNINSPIVATLAAASNLIYSVTTEGYVYALQATTGNQVWSKKISPDAGISASPLIVNGKLVIASRNGHVYCLDPTTGNLLWDFFDTSTSSPFLITPASDYGLVFVGNLSNYIYAIRLTDGNQVWKSQQLNTTGLKDWWPIVTQNKLVIRPYGRGRCPGVSSSTCTTQKTLYVLDAATGAEILPANPVSGANYFTHSDMPIQHGSMPPPCVTADNHLVTPSTTTYQNDYTGTTTHWGELDLTTGQMVDRYIAASQNNETGIVNLDENQLVTCAPNLTLIMHETESTHDPGVRTMGVSFSGIFNLTTRTYTSIGGAIGQKLGYSAAWHNTQGSGGSQVVIAQNKMFHVTLNTLNVRTFQ